MEEVSIPEGTLDGWICRIIAQENTWVHTRRKRRLAQRQLALKELKGEGGEDIEINSSVEEKNDTDETENSELSTEKERNEEERSDKVLVPILACKLCVKIESTNVEETVAQNDVCKIWMIFENGSGGLEALQSLRQYLINKLEVREVVLRDTTKPVKKRKKVQSKSDREAVGMQIEQPRLSNDERNIENA